MDPEVQIQLAAQRFQNAAESAQAAAQDLKGALEDGEKAGVDVDEVEESASATVDDLQHIQPVSPAP
ncbi:MAG: hypothetical protein JWR50_4393 [Mucilaginibacter sp.]|nr:hypothetical protein [Mucilaginibacter sp.]